MTDNLIEITELQGLGELKKLVMFTDIHWGAKQNSDLHNQDNLDYIDWLIEHIKAEKPSHVAFLGDWYENRSSINIMTLQYSYRGLKKLNALGIPVLFIIGNHDLYQRNTRDVHAADIFQELENFTVIDKPCSIGKDFLFLPFLFNHEYEQIAGAFNSFKYVFGHLEFRNFVMSGNAKIEHGPDHKMFSSPKRIFSGHYHKRQITDNVVYIGNVFPTNFGDAHDDARGCAIFEVDDNSLSFKDWEECPRYIKTTMSDIVEGNIIPLPKTRIRCTLDMDVSYLEAQTLRDEFIKTYNLREFTIEESAEKRAALEDMSGDEEEFEEINFDGVNEMVAALLETISDMDSIDAKKLVEIYRSL